MSSYGTDVNNPQFVFYVACAGLASNIISGVFLGVHEHSHGDADAVQLDLELLLVSSDDGISKVTRLTHGTETSPGIGPPSQNRVGEAELVGKEHKDHVAWSQSWSQSWP